MEAKPVVDRTGAVDGVPARYADGRNLKLIAISAYRTYANPVFPQQFEMHGSGNM